MVCLDGIGPDCAGLDRHRHDHNYQNCRDRDRTAHRITEGGVAHRTPGIWSELWESGERKDQAAGCNDAEVYPAHLGRECASVSHTTICLGTAFSIAATHIEAVHVGGPMIDRPEDKEPRKPAQPDISQHSDRARRWTWAVLVGTTLISVALAVARLASD